MFARRTGWNLLTNAFTQALEQHRAAGRELLDLSASNPTQVELIYDSNAILASLAKPESLHYDPQPRGLFSARRSVAGYYNARQEQLAPENVILTTSTSEAYSFVFRLLCDPGDELLIPTPSYPLFDYLAEIQDVRLLPYELIYDHGWQIDFHSLRQAITPRTRGIVLVHPNNPTGSFVKGAEREQLNTICREHDLALIVDEVFLDFSFGECHASFVSNTDALTFTLSGLSKISGLPQMKFAWIATTGPDELVKSALDRLEVIADTYLSMNAPIQHAIPELLEQRYAFQKQLNSRLRTNLTELDRQLATQKLCSRLKVEGGWYATLRVPATRSDEQLAIDLLDATGVLIHPGHFFDFPNDGYLVLSLMTPEPVFCDGLQRLLAFINA